MQIRRSIRLAGAMLALFFAVAFDGMAQAPAPQQPAAQPQQHPAAQPGQPTAPRRQPPPPPPLSLVMPTGDGRILIATAGLQWKGAHLYANNSKYAGPGYWTDLKPSAPDAVGKEEAVPVNPVLEFTDKAENLEVSFILFPNTGSNASAQGCRSRDAALAFPLIPPLAGSVDVVNKANLTTTRGKALATDFYMFKSGKDGSVQGKEVDGFYANPSTCAEISVSRAPYMPQDEPLLNAQLEAFTFEPNYTPTVQDYFGVGTIFYRLKSYVAAGVYYQRALDVLPANAPLNARRVLTSQLSIAYSLSGQTAKDRALNEAAIKVDPDYPMYYYALARADAAQGDVANTKLHLQQAFARQANMLPGDQMPDPMNDDSFAKLRKDPAFQSFLQALP